MFTGTYENLYRGDMNSRCVPQDVAYLRRVSQKIWTVKPIM
jgi:hypothetical protein